MESNVSSPRLPVVGIAAHQVMIDESGFTLLHFAAAVPYIKAVRRAGAIPVILPIIDPDDHAELDLALDAVDAVIVTGGCDVEPARYGAVQAPETGPLDARRDDTELALCRALVERDQPTLCVCRGIQVLNVALGGMLVPHLPELQGVGAHGKPGEPGGAAMNKVNLDSGSLLATTMDAERVLCSCHHHQALAPDRLGDGVRVTARSDDGVIEGIEVAGAWALAVQWHPEDTADYDPAQQRLFDALVTRARE